MKSYRSLVALLILFAFGVTFVALESHGASFCSSPEVSVHIAAASTQATDATTHSHSENQGCHCVHAANCSVAISSENSIVFVPVSLNRFIIKDELNSIVMDGLIKPPRA